jgi:release factor glutamine methyltransferase
MTIRDALLEAATQTPRRDTETLLAHLLQCSRAWLIAHADDPIAPKILTSFRSLVTRRAAQEPLQHITGTQEFFGLPLRVTPDVLIPRPETEHLVEELLAWAQTQSTRHLRVADVGTGSGAIALALAAHLPSAEITAIDISPAALAVARSNAEQLRLAHRIRFLEGDLLDPLQNDLAQGLRIDPRGWDAIISNPPYVADADAPTLAPEVRNHEPHLALFAGADGLAIYRRLIPQAHAALKPNGLLAMEIGFGQRNALAELLADPDVAWQNVRFISDYASIPRVVLATRR